MLNYILSCFVNSTQSKIEKIIKNEKNHLSEEIYNYENIIINDKLNNEKSNLVSGVMFAIAMVLNTIAFIIK